MASRPVDSREGHDGLVAVVEYELGLGPILRGGGGKASTSPHEDLARVRSGSPQGI